MEGKVWVFGDKIDTDNIFPTRFGGDASLEEMAKHIFYDYRPEFAKSVKPGDIIVAGYNFGCGSYRETAAAGLKALGIKIVIARSFARAFYRNAINSGVWLISIRDMDFSCEEGDVFDVEPSLGLITNKVTGKQISGTPLSGIAVNIVEAGGATSYFKPRVLHPFKVS